MAKPWNLADQYKAKVALEALRGGSCKERGPSGAA